MTLRMDLKSVVPLTYRAVGGLEHQVKSSGIDPILYELIKIRASQLNGCAFCLDMHCRDARTIGESQRRLDLLSAWREASSFFTDRERAALALTEAVTVLSDRQVPDDVWDDAARLFEEKELADVLMAIVVINAWNRMAVATHQSLPDLAEAVASDGHSH